MELSRMDPVGRLMGKYNDLPRISMELEIEMKTYIIIGTFLLKETKGYIDFL